LDIELDNKIFHSNFSGLYSNSLNNYESLKNDVKRKDFLAFVQEFSEKFNKNNNFYLTKCSKETLESKNILESVNILRINLNFVNEQLKLFDKEEDLIKCMNKEENNKFCGEKDLFKENSFELKNLSINMIGISN